MNYERKEDDEGLHDLPGLLPLCQRGGEEIRYLLADAAAGIQPTLALSWRRKYNLPWLLPRLKCCQNVIKRHCVHAVLEILSSNFTFSWCRMKLKPCCKPRNALLAVSPPSAAKMVMKRNLMWLVPLLKAMFAWDVVTCFQDLLTKDIPKSFKSRQAVKNTLW
jgi:hypothetical protein